MQYPHRTRLHLVAVRAVGSGSHTGHHYTLTGPHILTVAERLDVIATGINRDLQWIHRSPAEALTDFINAGWPPPYAETAFT